jgi:hypothetical protein
MQVAAHLFRQLRVGFRRRVLTVLAVEMGDVLTVEYFNGWDE